MKVQERKGKKVPRTSTSLKPSEFLFIQEFPDAPDACKGHLKPGHASKGGPHPEYENKPEIGDCGT